MIKNIDPNKKALKEADHVHIVMFNGSVESVSTLLDLIDETTDPILVLWVALPNLPGESLQRKRFRKTSNYVAKNYPMRDVIFADYMVKSDHEGEDFDSIGVCVFAFHLYNIIKSATVYWSTSSDAWEEVDKPRLSNMQRIANAVYSFEIVGADVPKSEQIKSIDSALQTALDYDGVN